MGKGSENQFSLSETCSESRKSLSALTRVPEQNNSRMFHPITYSFLGLKKAIVRMFHKKKNVIPTPQLSTNILRSFHLKRHVCCWGKTSHFLLVVKHIFVSWGKRWVHQDHQTYRVGFSTADWAQLTCWWFGVVLSKVIPSEVQDNTGDNIEKPGKVLNGETYRICHFIF